jgi:hypothetical protein
VLGGKRYPALVVREAGREVFQDRTYEAAPPLAVFAQAEIGLIGRDGEIPLEIDAQLGKANANRVLGRLNFLEELIPTFRTITSRLCRHFVTSLTGLS